MSQVLGVFGILDFTFLLGTRFETYEPFISLILNFFSGSSQPWITETTDTESADACIGYLCGIYWSC